MKNYSVKVSKQNGHGTPVMSLQEKFPTIFSNETTVLSSSIFVLKTISKTLIAHAKPETPMGILREISECDI